MKTSDIKVYMRQWYQNNKEVVKKRSAKYQKDHPKTPKKNIHYFRKHLYGEEYLNAPECPECCEVCGKKNKAGTNLSFDHDHKTGKFRGWLCSKCNRILGFADDDIEILEKLIVYLKHPIH